MTEIYLFFTGGNAEDNHEKISISDYRTLTLKGKINK